MAPYTHTLWPLSPTAPFYEQPISLIHIHTHTHTHNEKQPISLLLANLPLIPSLITAFILILHPHP